VGRGARARTDGDAGSLSRMSSSETVTETLGVTVARRGFSSDNVVVVVLLAGMVVLTAVVGLSLRSFSFSRWTRHDGESVLWR
jgi:hypothetical protein